jgi:hypothetical protein
VKRSGSQAIYHALEVTLRAVGPLNLGAAGNNQTLNQIQLPVTTIGTHAPNRSPSSLAAVTSSAANPVLQFLSQDLSKDGVALQKAGILMYLLHELPNDKKHKLHHRPPI